MTGDEARRELRRLRDSIDNMDSMLIHLLAERFKITQRVGELKAEAGLPPADPEREAEQIHRLRAPSAPLLKPCTTSSSLPRRVTNRMGIFEPML